MKKMIFSVALASALSANLLASSCEDSFKYDFTFFGGKDKSYVVTKNTFKDYKVTFNAGKLEGANLDINLFSLDTSADLNNGASKWPASMVNVRNMNTVNAFFKKFTKDVGKGKVSILKVNKDTIDVEFMLNGVKKVVPFSYVVENDMIKAKGTLDLLSFDTEQAWKAFTSMCSMAFHKGKSWSEIEVFFTVGASCK